MRLKNIYPIPERQGNFYHKLRFIMGIVFIVAILACVIVNLSVGGKAWSVVVVWSIISLWRLLFSLKIVEFSIFSHATRITFYLIVLLLLIDYFLYSGWAKTVIPIVLFGYLLIMFILFLSLRDKRDRHYLSIFILGLFAIAFIPYSIRFPIDNWIAFSFSIAILVLFIVLLIINFKDIVYEIKVRFKTNRDKL